MGLFTYKAKNAEGETFHGTVEAVSESSAQEALIERGLIVIFLRLKIEGTIWETSLHVFNRISAKDIVIFGRQFAVMIEANITIVRALKILATQTSNKKFRAVINEIAEDVDNGVKLSKAMEKHPEAFDGFFVHIIRAGETTGKLDEVLQYLADQKEKDYDVLNQVKGAMYYPVFVVAGMVAVGIIMMISVIPKLTAILEETGQALPLPTRIFIGFSNFFQSFWWILIFLVLFALLGVRVAISMKAGKLVVDYVKLQIPIFGNIYNKVYLARFSRSFATLLASGVPLTEALQITADVVDNAFYQKVLGKTIQAVTGGESVATEINKASKIPSMVGQMMRIGEETGKLDQVLVKMAEFYEKEVDALVRGLVRLVEPIIIILLGLGVFTLVVAILLPLYNLSGAF